MRDLLRSFGRETLVANDDQINVATAIAASGVAFALLFVEAMSDEAVRLGMSAAHAQQLVAQTFVGAGTLAAVGGASSLCSRGALIDGALIDAPQREPAQHCAVLRQAITSPGGTTAAGLARLEQVRARAQRRRQSTRRRSPTHGRRPPRQGAVRAAIAGGVAGAYERAVQLAAPK